MIADLPSFLPTSQVSRFAVLTFLVSSLSIALLYILLGRSYILDVSMEWLTAYFYYVFLGAFLLTITFEDKSLSIEAKCMLWLAFAGGTALSEALKLFFMADRPIVTELTLSREISYSFPSSHTASIFSILPIFFFKQRKYFYPLVVLGILVGFSRMYVGVHFYADVLGGMIAGLLTGILCYYLGEHLSSMKKFQALLEHDKEIRRQVAHLGFGLIIVALLQVQFISAGTLLFLLLVGSLAILCIKKWKNIPVLYPILSFFERAHHIEVFPGRGMFFFVLGSFLSVLLFPLHIAQASILILAFGDSITNVAGKYFGKIRLPYNTKKCLEGPLIASIFSTIAASYFVGFPHALIATLIAMTVETLPLYFGDLEIDDNLTIPLVAALVLFILN
ncbi:MAG: phosphatase PAP2 family protein [Candidatus Gracilibacteria bacterium]